jgi:hypothetical protein
MAKTMPVTKIETMTIKKIYDDESEEEHYYENNHSDGSDNTVMPLIITLKPTRGRQRCVLLCSFFQHWIICRPTDSTVSEDAGIEPTTVVTSALADRRSNHSARSHPRDK